jgi:di/tricarboxylate transporter
MIPPTTAMRSTGAAELLADQLIPIVGGLGTRATLPACFSSRSR